MRSTRSILLAGVAVGLAATGPVRAADVTPAQASSFEAQLRDAVSKVLGPSVKLPDRPVRITADGDHYDMAVPFPVGRLVGLGGPSAPGAAPGTAPASGMAEITGSAKLGDDGIWTVEHVQLTSPLNFTAMMPVPRSDDDPAAPKTTAVAYTIEQKGQDGHIVWDPTFHTPSTWTASSQATTAHAVGGPIEQDTTVGPTNATTTLRPDGPDRVDLLVAGDMQDYDIDGTKSATPMRVAMKRLRLASTLNNVSRENGLKLLQAMSTLVAANVPKSSPALNPLVKAVLGSLQDLASDFMLDETVEGATVQVAGQNVTMDRLRLEVDARSDAGLLRAGMDFGLGGIGLPDFPLGPFADLLPQQVDIRPVIGGVTAQDLLHMANLATDNIDPSQADITAFFSHGGVTGGIESMTVEVGGATFTGQGKVVATAPTPQSVTGTAELTAENFDALMQRVTSIPALAQQAVPALVFIKGIGRNVGDKLVWDISYKDNKVLVNNVDLTAMAGGGQAQRPAPRATPGGALKQPARPTAPGQIPNWGK